MIGLDLLAKNARDWSRAYTSVVEALVAEGVPKEVARYEAQEAASRALFFDLHEDGDDGPVCPVCGRGGEGGPLP